MIRMTLDEIAAITEGRLVNADPATVITGGVEYDSRLLTPGGLIMTNNHVVAAMAKVPSESASAMVRFDDGRAAAFSVVATDPKSDIAIVRAEGISGLAPISFGSSADLRA